MSTIKIRFADGGKEEEDTKMRSPLAMHALCMNIVLTTNTTSKH